MEKETESKRKQIVKKVAAIFLVLLLVLTFFSNTIMNYSLPEVSTEPVTTGTVSNKVRGQGTVEMNSDYEVMVSGARVIKEVKVEQGDEVKAGDVLFTFEEGENTELSTEEDTLNDMELNYAKSLLKMAPDYTDDNEAIKEAKAKLKKAVDALEEAKKTDKKLKAAKKEAEQIKKDIAAQQKKVDDLQEKVDAYGQVGDYEEAKKTVDDLTENLEKLKRELADHKEDLQMAEAEGGETTSYSRLIRDTELEISAKEADLKLAKQNAETLKTTSATYKQLSDDLKTANKALSDLKTSQEEKEAKVTELSGKLTLEQAKDDVAACRKDYETQLRALKKRKEEDSLTQQGEALDNQDAQEKIEKQKEKIEKMKASDDIREVKAKEDGVVSEITCKEGDSVTADAPLAKIQLSESGYIVKVTVTKAQAKLIRTGDEATVENVWDEDLEASVKSIKASPDNPNQNMVVTFEVKGNVNPGETLVLSAGEKSNRYDAVVPNNAIREDSKGKFVLVVTVKGTPLGNRYKVKRADVEVQASDDTSSGVTGGVYEYDNVVTTSSKPLENGMQVRLAE
ncbi:MAG: HlyD family efflux transporter periplasmic adaptor subunit [Clostridiales bacterium]|nr:HlyD family efflux transporter periplasmic adaptor subunit [Clostridiales bacterium]